MRSVAVVSLLLLGLLPGCAESPPGLSAEGALSRAMDVVAGLDPALLSLVALEGRVLVIDNGSLVLVNAPSTGPSSGAGRALTWVATFNTDVGRLAITVHPNGTTSKAWVAPGEEETLGARPSTEGLELSSTDVARIAQKDAAFSDHVDAYPAGGFTYAYFASAKSWGEGEVILPIPDRFERGDFIDSFDRGNVWLVTHYDVDFTTDEPLSAALAVIDARKGSVAAVVVGPLLREAPILDVDEYLPDPPASVDQVHQIPFLLPPVSEDLRISVDVGGMFVPPETRLISPDGDVVADWLGPLGTERHREIVVRYPEPGNWTLEARRQDASPMGGVDIVLKVKALVPATLRDPWLDAPG